MDCAQKIFIGLKVAPLPTDQGVVGEKSDKSLKKVEKCIFVKFLVSQNCLPDEKMALKKALPDRRVWEGLEGFGGIREGP